MRLRMDQAQRWIVGVVFPVLFVVALVGPYLVLRGDLPSPIATHFEGDGTADGSMPVGGFLAMMGVLALGSAAVLVRSGWRPGSALGIQAAVATFVGVTASWVTVLVILANDGVARWQDATLGAGSVWGATASAFGTAMPVALMVGRRDECAPPPRSPARPGVALGEGERAAWFGGARSLPLGLTALVLAYMATVVLLTLGSGSVASGLLVLAVALVVAAFIEVRASVSNEGVRVRSGVFGWPRVRIPLEAIESADVIDLRPLRWGGWGYRGSLRLFRRAAWVLRAGPALRLHLTGGREFAVTVDDAEEAAGVLHGLLRAR